MIDFAAPRKWLFDYALPFWSTTGLSPTGGFVEYLDSDARPVEPGYTRTRVQARQIFVFSQAEIMGFTAGRSAADRGYRLLLETAWLGPKRGWARRITQDGDVLDDTPDLYDLAFVLFALAWRYRTTQNPACLDLANQTLDFLDLRMRHPSGGFINAADAGVAPRQQNPHMHLLEAAQALYEARPDARFAALAAELVQLFTGQFFDPQTGSLGEFFEQDWRRAKGETGRMTEPGHQFEWSWILAHHQRLFGRTDLVATIVRLIDVATEHGVNPTTGLTYDSVRDDGVILSAASRCWCQTERLKAELARAEFMGSGKPQVISQILTTLFERYFSRKPYGTWNEHLGSDGGLIVDRIPASTLYHVALALFELLRLEPLLSQDAATP